MYTQYETVDLILDPAIRNFVLFPILMVVLCKTFLTTNLMQWMQNQNPNNLSKRFVIPKLSNEADVYVPMLVGFQKTHLKDDGLNFQKKSGGCQGKGRKSRAVSTRYVKDVIDDARQYCVYV
eukprot:UN01396